MTMIVQEIGAGGDLFASIRERGPFPEQIARLYFTQMCQAVLYCHQNGVVHRYVAAVRAPGCRPRPP